MPVEAGCVLNGEKVNGVVKLSLNTPQCPVDTKGEIKGLTEGLHGFDIHEFGDNTNGCTTAGAHFNPNNSEHGAPTDCDDHVNCFPMALYANWKPGLFLYEH